MTIQNSVFKFRGPDRPPDEHLEIMSTNCARKVDCAELAPRNVVPPSVFPPIDEEVSFIVFDKSNLEFFRDINLFKCLNANIDKYVVRGMHVGQDNGRKLEWNVANAE